MFSVCCTDCLHRLEEAVKYQVPDHLPLFDGRNEPDQEIRRNSKWSRAEDPEGKQKGTAG